MSEKTLKEKTARGFIWGGIGNGAQLFLGLLFGIFLARLLSPSDYGMVGMLQVFSTLASILQDSGFRIALANRKEIRHEDYNAVFWFNVCTSTAIYILLFFCAPLITDFYQKSDLAGEQDLTPLTPLARFTFLGFFIASLGTAHYAYLFRTLQVKQKAFITITSITLSSLGGVGMAMAGFAYWGLAAQGVLFTTCNTVLFWHFSRWRPTLPVSFRPLRNMFGFSVKLLITDLCNNINGNILTVMLGRFFSTYDVGIYSQANKWTWMGNNLVIGAVKDVAQPVLRGVSDDRERHKRVFRKMLRFTSFLAFPAAFGLALISRELILISVTDKWIDCVPLMHILCTVAFTPALVFLCQNLVITKGRSDLIMWNTIAYGTVQTTTLFLSQSYGIHTMVCAFAALNAAWLGVWFYFVHKEIGLRLREAIADTLPFAAIAAGTMVATAWVTSPVNNLYLLFILKIVMAAVLYMLLMRLSGSVIFKECTNYLLHKGNRRKSQNDTQPLQH